MPALTYEKLNREAYFVVDHIKRNPAAAIRVSWKPGIGRKSTIGAGDVLATLTWSDGTKENLVAPAGCNGVIAATNRRLKYALLSKPPAQWVLRLKAE